MGLRGRRRRRTRGSRWRGSGEAHCPGGGGVGSRPGRQPLSAPLGAPNLLASGLRGARPPPLLAEAAIPERLSLPRALLMCRLPGTWRMSLARRVSALRRGDGSEAIKADSGPPRGPLEQLRRQAEPGRRCAPPLQMVATFLCFAIASCAVLAGARGLPFSDRLRARGLCKRVRTTSVTIVS